MTCDGRYAPSEWVSLWHFAPDRALFVPWPIIVSCMHEICRHWSFCRNTAQIQPCCSPHISPSSACSKVVRIHPYEMADTNSSVIAPPFGVIPNFDNPDSQRDAIISIGSIFTALAVCSMALQFYTRLSIQKAGIGWDDGWYCCCLDIQDF